jgi:hypothetical protein
MKYTKNITTLACWHTLQNLGFEIIRFRINGKIAHIGAVLKISDKELLIEPHFYNSRPYHISYYGENVTCNVHVDARQILPLINDLLNSINTSK